MKKNFTLLFGLLIPLMLFAQVESKIVERWDASLSDYTNNAKTEYVYDAAGNIIEEISYDWDATTDPGNPVWVPSIKNVYEFTNGYQTLKEYYNQYVDGAFVAFSREVWTYDVDGNETFYEKLGWDATAMDWGLKAYNQKRVKAYNTNGELTRYEAYTCKDVGGVLEWVGTYIYNYEFDVDGNKILYAKDNLASPQYSTKDQYIYTDGILTGALGFYGFVNSEWVPSTRTTYTYPAATGIFNSDNLKLNFYPNPATDYVTISVKSTSGVDVELYNMTGAKVLQKSLLGSSRVAVSHLPTGYYLLKVIQDGKVYMGKLSIK